MQIEMQGIWLVICIVIAVFVLLKITKAVSKVIILALIVCLFFAGAKVIDLNTIAPDLMEKVSSVTEMVGENLVKTEGKSVLVKINDKWYDISKLAVVGNLATEDIILKYDGEEIYVGHTGVVNVLKVLDKFGLIEIEE